MAASTASVEVNDAEIISAIDLSTETPGTVLVIETASTMHWITMLGCTQSGSLFVTGVSIHTTSKTLVLNVDPTQLMISKRISVGSTFRAGSYRSSTVKRITRISGR